MRFIELMVWATMACGASAPYDVEMDWSTAGSGAVWEYLAGLKLLPTQDISKGWG